MKLQDLRKFAIQQQTRIKFSFGDSFQCIVDEHGIAKVPSPKISSAPPFNLEQELANAHQFSLEPVGVGSGSVRPRTLSRPDLEALVGAASTSANPDQHHDDE